MPGSVDALPATSLLSDLGPTTGLRSPVVPRVASSRTDHAIVGLTSSEALIRIVQSATRNEPTFVVPPTYRPGGQVHEASQTHAAGHLHSPQKDETDVVWIQSGGSTGPAKQLAIDLSPRASRLFAVLMKRTGWVPGMRQLSVLPLYHAAGLITTVAGWRDGNRLFMLPRFSSEAVVHAVGELGIDWVCLTPTHMSLLARDGVLNEFAASSARVMHTGGPCSPELKRQWLGALGADRVHEMYSSSEQTGITLCSGQEWLERPGTVGRGVLTAPQVVDERGDVLPPGQLGSVRLTTLTRIAARQENRTPGGDRGWVDADGFLFLTGRDPGSTNVGGELVRLAPVQDAIKSTPGVHEARVVAIHDATLGHVVGAVVAASSPATKASILSGLRENFPPAWIPRVVKLVTEMPADERGKTTYQHILDILANGRAPKGEQR